MATETCFGKSFYKCFILLLLFYINWTIFFSIEMPSGLQGTIIRVFEITATEFNLLFSALIWGDIILSLVGGVLIDRVIGLRAGYMIFVVVTITGQAIATMGAFMNSFYVIVAGRFILGCGVSTVINTAFAFMASWFTDNERTFASAVISCGIRLGGATGLILPQVIYDNLNIVQYFHLHGNHCQVGFTFLLGFAFLFSSLFACILIVILDTKGGNMLERAPFTRRDTFQFKDLKDFSLKFWIIIVSKSLFYTVLFIFVANGQLFFTSKFGVSITEANNVVFLVFAVPVLITPIVGLLIDVIGFHIIWCICGALVGIFAHTMFNVIMEWSSLPYLLTLLFSLSYCLYATAITVLPTLIVQEHQVTTAYGLYTSVFSLVFISSSAIAGAIIDHAGFMWMEMFLAFLLCMCLALVIDILLMEMSPFASSKVNKAGSWLRAYLDQSNNKLKNRKAEIIDEEMYSYND